MAKSSVIWRMVTQQVGSIQEFHSERDMESYLMNNPSLIVQWDPEKGNQFPLKEQIGFPHSEQTAGRIDIIGLAKLEEGYEIRVFELKNGTITIEAVEQIRSYLDQWKSADSLKADIVKWIVDMKLPNLNEIDIKNIVANPKGVLIGTAFEASAIARILDTGQSGIKINAVRLARFKGEAKNEYYIIIEDQIGEIIKKRLWSWQELVDKGAMELGDYFLFKHKGRQLRAKPDPQKASWNWIFILFDDKSRKLLLDNEATIKANMHPDMKKKIETGIASLRDGKSIALSNATALAFFFFGIQERVYLTPTPYWHHERSGKTLSELKSL